MKRLGYEELHEDAPGMYNEPLMKGDNIINQSGIAPINRGQICATYMENNVLYFLGEDDCHFFEDGVLKQEDLPDLLKDLNYLNGIIEDGHARYNKNKRFVVEYRKETSDLVHIAMGNFIITYDIAWIPDIIKVIENTINILNEVNPKYKEL